MRRKRTLRNIFISWRAKQQNTRTAAVSLKRVLTRVFRKVFERFRANFEFIEIRKISGARAMIGALTGSVPLRMKDALGEMRMNKLCAQASDWLNVLVASAKLIGTVSKIETRQKTATFGRLLGGTKMPWVKSATVQTEVPLPSQQDLDAYAEIVRKMEDRIHVMEIERAALIARLAATKEDMKLFVSRSLDVSTVNSLGG
jgi:hypothetical protein